MLIRRLKISLKIYYMGSNCMKYSLIKIFCKLFRQDFNKASIKYFRKKGINIGEHCHIYSDITTTESFLVKIKDNVTISTNVILLTHDNSICKADNNLSDIFGKIEIGKNCFIGANTLILPGVKINDGIIVGAGSVVSKSLTEKNSVYVGNPAKRICSINEYYEKNKKYAVNINGMSSDEKKECIMKSKMLER